MIQKNCHIFEWTEININGHQNTRKLKPNYKNGYIEHKNCKWKRRRHTRRKENVKYITEIKNTEHESKKN